jgi:hypothetical protein
MPTGEWGIVKSWSRAGGTETVAPYRFLTTPRICKSEVANSGYLAPLLTAPWRTRFRKRLGRRLAILAVR